eukprot:8521982-Pyramimonas_sp.AAC.1
MLIGRYRSRPNKYLVYVRTVETHAKKHPACLQDALGFLGHGFCDGKRDIHQKSMEVLLSQGWRCPRREQARHDGQILAAAGPGHGQNVVGDGDGSA